MSLTLRDVACLTAFPCVMTLAQFLFKATAGNAAGRGLKAALPVFFRQPSFYAAMAAYAGATVLWLWLLSRYSLAQAYPFTALAFLLVPLVETLFFGVRANRLYWAGLALIVVGAALVGRAQVG
jgi:drug/metabolite transporter (DMT)-like permease